MPRKRKRYHKEKKHYPILQGHLVDTSKTELCSTERHKTSFDVVDIITKKIIPCVYWGFLKDPIEKGQLVILEGISKNECFICFDVKKIDVPYVFG